MYNVGDVVKMNASADGEYSCTTAGVVGVIVKALDNNTYTIKVNENGVDALYNVNSMHFSEVADSGKKLNKKYIKKFHKARELDLTYRDIKIPKKGGKFRKVSAPSKDLKRYQRKKLKGLYGVFRNRVQGTILEDVHHGFIKGRNCVTAAKRHIGYDCTIMMDLKDFFDTCKMNHVTRVAPELTDEHLYHDEQYCAQGFVTSPILANIAIIPALTELKKYLDRYHKGSVLTIYADDIQISINKDDECSYKKEQTIVKRVSMIMEGHGFRINESKTRMKYAKYGYRRILGVNVGDTEVRATRKVMRKIRAARHQENWSSLGGLTTWSKCLEPKSVQ